MGFARGGDLSLAFLERHVSEIGMFRLWLLCGRGRLRWLRRFTKEGGCWGAVGRDGNLQRSMANRAAYGCRSFLRLRLMFLVACQTIRLRGNRSTCRRHQFRPGRRTIEFRGAVEGNADF